MEAAVRVTAEGGARAAEEKVAAVAVARVAAERVAAEAVAKVATERVAVVRVAVAQHPVGRAASLVKALAPARYRRPREPGLAPKEQR